MLLFDQILCLLHTNLIAEFKMKVVISVLIELLFSLLPLHPELWMVEHCRH